jgi:hypothetical protein
MPVPAVADKIFGAVGTPVTLTLLRKGLNGQVARAPTREPRAPRAAARRR